MIRLSFLPRLFLIGAAVGILCLAGAASLVAAPDKTIVFKKVEGKPLELHCFFPEGHTPAAKRPAIVFFFGGGWKQGQPGQFYPQCNFVAKNGMVAISAQYRTFSSHATGPKEAVQDGRSALRYVRAHAAELGIDPEKILAGGGSAGGHVAACTAIADGPDEPGEATDVTCRPAALALFNPVLDVGPEEGYAHGYVKNSIAEWERISPIHRIAKTSPPTLIQVGTQDKVLPIPLAEKYKARMEAEGIRCDLVTYEGEAHGFFNRPPNNTKAIEAMGEFLRSLGYLGVAAAPPK